MIKLAALRSLLEQYPDDADVLLLKGDLDFREPGGIIYLEWYDNQADREHQTQLDNSSLATWALPEDDCHD